MLILASAQTMVNFGLNIASLLGLLDIALAIAYSIVSLGLPITRSRDLGSWGVALFLAQVFIAPGCLLLAGTIHIFQGWRLDPILQFAYLLFNLLVIYLLVKDVLLFRILSTRNQR